MNEEKIRAYQEAERRGILPPDKQALWNEVKRRGLISAQFTTSPQKVTQEKQSNISQNIAGLATGVLHGATFGFDDEAIAHAAAAYKKQFGTTTEREMSYKDLYTQERDQLRQAQQQIRKEAPVASLVGEIGGSILGGGAAAKGLQTVGRGIATIPTLSRTGQVLQSATQAGGVGKTALQGATGGALYGAGEAENTENIPSSVAGGAALGGVGGVVGQAIGGTLKGGVQKLLGVDKEIAQAIQESGLTPTLADISTSPTVQRVQNFLSSAPLAGDIIQNARQKTIADIEKNLFNVTQSRGGTIAEAGDVIREGLQNRQQKILNTRNILYKKLDDAIPKETVVPLNNLNTTLTGDYAQTVAKYFGGTPQKILSKMEDVQSLPYSEVRVLRTSIGNRLQSASITGDEKAVLQQMYRGLTDDMRDVATAQGEKSLQAFNRANQYHAKSQKAFDDYINPLIEAKTPDRVYQLALAGSKTGGGQIQRVMKSLNQEQRQFVQGNVIRQMGLAKAGSQDATGSLFSTNQFLTEWNKFSPEARERIFSPEQITSINKLNTTISAIKNVGNMQNTSKNIPYLLLAGAGLTAYDPNSLQTTIPLIAGGIGAAHLMTNPKVLNWLTSSVPQNTSNQKMKVLVKQWLSEGAKLATKNPLIAEDIINVLQTQQENNNPNTDNPLK